LEKYMSKNGGVPGFIRLRPRIDAIARATTRAGPDIVDNGMLIERVRPV
jgi:hypothetical protein